MDSPPRVRIAPSPTGAPHVGTVYIALFNFALAKKLGGQFVLRIDDTDQKRSRREYESDIFDALRWAGLSWHEGPDVGGPHAPYRQSERQAIYNEYAQQLLKSGAAYRCWCTPKRLETLRRSQDADKGKRGYDKHCLHLADSEIKAKEKSGDPHVIRLNIDPDGETRFKDRFRDDAIVWSHNEVDDQVLLKSDGMPTYHLATVIDDHLMGITHVIRAEEWIASTPKHVLLYDAFGWEPPQFCHMPLLRNDDKSKISKRKNPVSVGFYRRLGILPEGLVNFLAMQGYSMPDEREVFTLAEFVDEFDLDRVSLSSPIFDLRKLKAINAEHIRKLTPDDLRDRVIDFTRAWFDDLGAEAEDGSPLRMHGLEVLSDFSTNTWFYPAWEVAIDKDSFAPATTRVEAAKLGKALKDYAKAIINLQPHEWTADALKEAFTPLLAKYELEHRKDRTAIMQAIRIAISGRTFTPPLFDTLAAMERYSVNARLVKAIEMLSRR